MMVAEGDMEGRVIRAQTSLLLTHSLRVLEGEGELSGADISTYRGTR